MRAESQKGDEQEALNKCRGDEGCAGESGEGRQGLRRQPL